MLVKNFVVSLLSLLCVFTIATPAALEHVTPGSSAKAREEFRIVLTTPTSLSKSEGPAVRRLLASTQSSSRPSTGAGRTPHLPLPPAQSTLPTLHAASAAPHKQEISNKALLFQIRDLLAHRNHQALLAEHRATKRHQEIMRTLTHMHQEHVICMEYIAAQINDLEKAISELEKCFVAAQSGGAAKQQS
jgi:hypothetical protein